MNKEEKARPLHAGEVSAWESESLSGPSKANIQSPIHELRAHQIELEMQNKELRRVQAELEESRNKYADLYDFAPVGYFTLDKDGIIQEVNTTCLELLGVERDSLIRSPLSRCIVKENQDVFRSYIKRLLENVTRQTCELKMFKRDGTPFYAQLEGIAVFDKGGNFSHFRVAMFDVTERKQTEEALKRAYDELELRVQQRTRELIEANAGLQTEIAERKRAEEALRVSEEKHRTLLEHSYDFILETNVDGIFLYASPQYKNILGYEPSELIGRSIFEHIHPDDVGAVMAEFQRVIPTLSSGGAIFRYRHKNGEWRWFESKGTAFKTASGEVRGVINSRDITEHKQSEEALRKAHDDLEARVKERTAELVEINEVLQEEIVKRRQVEVKLEETLKEVEKSRDDMLSILNQLNLGTAIISEKGCITFINQTLKRFLGSGQEVVGKRWEEMCHFQEQDKALLQTTFRQPQEQRTRVPVHIETPLGRQYWMEVDIKDDPLDPPKRILFFYDMTEIHDLRRQLDERAQFQDMIGKSEPMKLIYRQIQDVAKGDWTVLIEGETGTGKELVAKAIHFSSHRKDKPFLVVNCAGLTDSLLGSQLFGHKRGAFTGAVEDHKGLFEAASGGTIFLDEIGDISMNVQTSLLRVLEGKEITRLGETKPRKIDVRILAATHKDLSKEVQMGNFRADLFYRLKVAKILLPPLRERREDIPLLVASFLSQCRAATTKDVHDVSNETMRVLMAYSWPGNVRELKNAIEFAFIRCRNCVIQVDDLPLEVVNSNSFQPLHEGSSLQDEKRLLLSALERAGGNRTVAARLLGMSRATFYRRLGSLGTKGNN